MGEFFTAISNFGFPIVLAGYLLLRFEKKLDELTRTIDKLDTSVNNLINNRNRR